MKKKKLLSDRRQMPIIVGRFFRGFVEPVRPWFKELVSKYKESRMFPLMPTVIADFYEDRNDKEIAVLSAFCMDWDGDIKAQIQAMKTLMGKHPWEWFVNRLFVNISIATRQDDYICTGCARNWKLARFFDRLYMRYKEEKSLSKCFSRKGSLEAFAEATSKEIEYTDGWKYKINVIELVLRTSDGIGQNLWGSGKMNVKCPHRKEINDFLRVWVNDYKWSWGFDDTVSWFGFDRNYDFFYFFLAWKFLSRRKPRTCSSFATVFYNRYDSRLIVPAYRWKDYFPEIDF